MNSVLSCTHQIPNVDQPLVLVIIIMSCEEMEHL